MEIERILLPLLSCWLL